MSQRKSWFKITRDVVAKKVTLAFVNGDKVEISMTEMPLDLQIYAALHGFGQKIGDLVAPASREGYSVAEAASICQDRVDDMILTGEWNKSAKADTPPRLVIRAMVEHLPDRFDSIETATSVYEAMAEADQKTVKSHVEIQKLVKRYQLEALEVKAETADDTSDLDELFE